MALPTAAELKVRHPRFAAVDDTTVDVYIAEAGRTVLDTVWAASDYADGVMYLAAHLMEMEGAIAPTGNPVGMSGQVKKKKAGEVEIEYHAPANHSQLSDDLYRTTIYGRRYLELAARNGGVGAPAILVV